MDNSEVHVELDDKAKQLFVFEIDSNLYAVDVGYVDRVMKIPPITPIPNAPAAIVGIFHLRGKVVVVLDLARRMNIPKKKPLTANFLFVVRRGKDEYAILVDKPKIIVQILPSEIRPPDQILAAHVPSEYVLGVFMQEEQVIKKKKQHSIMIETPGSKEGNIIEESLPPRPVAWLNVEKLLDHDDLLKILASQE